MNGQNKTALRQGAVKNWVLELLIPGVFSIILMACLAHMACSALQTQCEPVAGFQYAISAFAL